MTGKARKANDDYFNTANGSVSAEYAMPLPGNLLSQIDQIREAFPNISKETAAIILQSCECSIEKAILTITQDGAENILSSWNFQGKKGKNGFNSAKSRRRKNKKNKLQNKASTFNGESTCNSNSDVTENLLPDEEESNARSQTSETAVSAVESLPSSRHSSISIQSEGIQTPQPQKTEIGMNFALKHHPEASKMGSSKNRNSIVDAMPRSARDLQRSAVAIARFHLVLEEKCEKAAKEIKTHFKRIRESLSDREQVLNERLESVKVEAAKLLNERQEQAATLKHQCDRIGRLRDQEISELRSEIKHFVGDRKIDEEVANTNRFVGDPEEIVKAVESFGHVNPLKADYKPRSAWLFSEIPPLKRAPPETVEDNKRDNVKADRMGNTADVNLEAAGKANRPLTNLELKECAETHSKLKEAVQQQTSKVGEKASEEKPLSHAQKSEKDNSRTERTLEEKTSEFHRGSATQKVAHPDQKTFKDDRQKQRNASYADMRANNASRNKAAKNRNTYEDNGQGNWRSNADRRFHNRDTRCDRNAQAPVKYSKQGKIGKEDQVEAVNKKNHESTKNVEEGISDREKEQYQRSISEPSWGEQVAIDDEHNERTSRLQGQIQHRADEKGHGRHHDSGERGGQHRTSEQRYDQHNAAQKGQGQRRTNEKGQGHSRNYTYEDGKSQHRTSEQRHDQHNAAQRGLGQHQTQEKEQGYRQHYTYEDGKSQHRTSEQRHDQHNAAQRGLGQHQTQEKEQGYRQHYTYEDGKSQHRTSEQRHDQHNAAQKGLGQHQTQEKEQGYRRHYTYEDGKSQHRTSEQRHDQHNAAQKGLGQHQTQEKEQGYRQHYTYEDGKSQHEKNERWHGQDHASEKKHAQRRTSEKRDNQYLSNDERGSHSRYNESGYDHFVEKEQRQRQHSTWNQDYSQRRSSEQGYSQRRTSYNGRGQSGNSEKGQSQQRTTGKGQEKHIDTDKTRVSNRSEEKGPTQQPEGSDHQQTIRNQGQDRSLKGKTPNERTSTRAVNDEEGNTESLTRTSESNSSRQDASMPTRYDQNNNKQGFHHQERMDRRNRYQNPNRRKMRDFDQNDYARTDSVTKGKVNSKNDENVTKNCVVKENLETEKQSLTNLLNSGKLQSNENVSGQPVVSNASHPIVTAVTALTKDTVVEKSVDERAQKNDQIGGKQHDEYSNGHARKGNNHERLPQRNTGNRRQSNRKYNNEKSYDAGEMRNGTRGQNQKTNRVASKLSKDEGSSSSSKPKPTMKEPMSQPKETSGRDSEARNAGNRESIKREEINRSISRQGVVPKELENNLSNCNGHSKEMQTQNDVAKKLAIA